jgi:hypothetical protein
MQSGSPDSYATWLQRGGGAPGGGQQDQLQQLLSMLFGQQQQPRRPDYSQLFANSQVNLEGPSMMTQSPQSGANYNTFSNKPAYSFGNINPYA